MIVTRSKINKLILNIIIIISIMSYEMSLYNKYYKLMLAIVMILGLLMMFVNLLDHKSFYLYRKILSNNLLVHFISINLILSTCTVYIIDKSISIMQFVNVLLIVVSFYVFYLFMPNIFIKNYKSHLKLLKLIITFFSIVSIIIKIKGSFLVYYPTHYPRIASMLFDPNYFSIIATVGFLISIENNKKINIFSILNLFGVVLSGSRTAVLSLCITLLIFYLHKNKLKIKTLLIFIIIALLMLLFIMYLYKNNFFRVNQGLNSRDFLWKISLELIKESPFYGHGYGNTGIKLLNKGAVNRSAHNSYFDYAIAYGLPSLISYMLIILRALWRGLKNQTDILIMKIIIFILISSNFINISLGGLGITSLILTLLMGVSNLSYLQSNNIGYSQVYSRKRKVYFSNR